MKSYLQRRWRKWWMLRLRASDDVTLHQRNVYIVPNGAGWMMALTIAVLLLTSVNYQLNLGYLLTFMVAGASFASIMVGHANLRGVTLTLVPPTPTRAQEALRIQITCTNTTKRHKHAIALSAHDEPLTEDDLTWVSLAPGESRTVGVRLPAMARGLHPAPLLRARTSYPLGLLKVWTVWKPASRLAIYPVPESPTPPWPEGSDAVVEEAPAGASPQRSFDEIDGVRAYRPGDPPKTIVWKKVSTASFWNTPKGGPDQTPPWVVRELAPPAQPPRVFDLAQTGCADREKALSRLCAWVWLAHESGMDYGLQLPSMRDESTVQTGQGDAHLRHCLEALAAC